MSNMSIIDASFFMLETPERPMHVSPLIVLDPPQGFRGNFADKLHKRLLKRPVGAPFDHTAHFPKTGLFGSWKKQKAVKVEDHVFRVHAPDDMSIDDYVCNLYEGLLDLSKPLWQFYVISKNNDRRVYLFGKIHHALFDGVGLVNLFARTLSENPKDRHLVAPWEGRKQHQSDSNSKSLLASGVSLISRTASRGPALMNSVITASKMYLEQYLQKAGVQKIERGMANPFDSNAGYFNVMPEKQRSFAHCTLSLPRMKAVAKAHEASVNDVFMAVIDAAVSRLLTENKVKMKRPLIAEMMMATKGNNGGSNNFSPVHLSLGRPKSNIAKRLAEIRSHTSVLKAKVKGLDTGTMLMYSMPLILAPLIIEKLNRQNAPVLSDIFVSNPFGLPRQGYMMGARVESTLPISSVVAGHVMNITGVSNVDQFHIGVVALKSAIPDPNRLTRYMTESFNELDAATPSLARPRNPKAATAKKLAKKPVTTATVRAGASKDQSSVTRRKKTSSSAKSSTPAVKIAGSRTPEKSPAKRKRVASPARLQR